jgi:hypothetical protein
MGLYALVENGLLYPPFGIGGMPFGIPPYSYSWVLSLNPNFMPILSLGNSSSLYLNEPPYCSPFYIKLTIKSADGYTRTFAKRITCIDNCPREKREDDLSLYKDQLKLFPNPASSMVSMSFLNGKIEYVDIRNVFGVLIKKFKFDPSEQNTELDVSDLTNGLYIVSTLYKSQHITELLIVLK